MAKANRKRSKGDCLTTLLGGLISAGLLVAVAVASASSRTRAPHHSG